MQLSDLSLAGWLLLLGTIIGALGLGIPCLVMIEQALPAGRYPRIVFLIPTILIGLVIWFGGTKLLAVRGISIRK